MKALGILKVDRGYYRSTNNDESIIEKYDEAIKELEDLQNTINTVIEEIDYALAKPDYVKNYLGNAKRFLGNLNKEEA